MSFGSVLRGEVRVDTRGCCIRLECTYVIEWGYTRVLVVPSSDCVSALRLQDRTLSQWCN